MDPNLIKGLLGALGVALVAVSQVIHDPATAHVLASIGGFLAGGALLKRPGDVSYAEVIK
jgi:hypothetical protein